MHYRLKAAIAVGAIGLAATTTAAFAAWSSSGSGTTTAQSGHDVPSHVTAAGFAPDLFPGGTDTVTVNIDNPNPYPVIVTSISGAQAPAVNAGTCPNGSVYSDAIANAAGVAQTAAAGAIITPHSSGIYALTGHMVADATDGCKDQTFPLSLTVTLQSAAS